MTSATLPLLALAALASLGPAARADDLHLRLGYDGRFSIFGKILDAEVETRTEGDSFQGAARIQSAGLLQIFKRIEERASARGRITDGEAQPGLLRYDNPGDKKYRKVEVTWSDGGVVTTASPPLTSWGDPVATPAQKQGAVDPLTQVTRFALSPTAPDCRGAVRFFDGVQRYDMEYVGRETAERSAREQRLGLGDPVRCRIRYRELAGFKKKPPEKRDQGLQGAMYLSFARLGAHGPWVISALEADTRWGHASIVLERLSTPTGGPPQDRVGR